ncbi:hypothetical protein KBD45_03185 [Candidatus Dojkabacteria bacterium]|nr:hypothetical protein [Candidatus Dojkabacteria bacterium]
MDKSLHNKITIPDLAIDLMLLGGQSFCWEKTGKDEYLGIDKDGVIEVHYDGQILSWQTYPDENNFNKISQYFRLDTKHEAIHKQIFFDENVLAAHKYSKTIRLLRQDFEVAFFSFILSQNNSLPIIRHRVRKLNEKFGKKYSHKGNTVFLFPEVEVLANASLVDLQECKLGYRAKYVKNGAEFLLENKEFYKKLEYPEIKNEEEIRQWLMKVNGIGDKVADCILLYGLAYDNVFPMDLWGKRILSKYYGFSEKENYKHLRSWIKAHFKGYAGWAGQYLFEYARNNWGKINAKN